MINQIYKKNTFYSSIDTISLLIIFLLLITVPAYTSDSSDAENLMKKCERESKALEVPVTNFGSESEKSEFRNGIEFIKIGQVKYAQTKYLDASAQFKIYLKMQNNIYDTICSSYIKRTEKILEDTGTDLAGFIDNPKVEQYIKLANQNLADAKASMSRKEFTVTIANCRTAKKYAIKAYEIAGKNIPDQYKTDLKDIENKI